MTEKKKTIKYGRRGKGVKKGNSHWSWDPRGKTLKRGDKWVQQSKRAGRERGDRTSGKKKQTANILKEQPEERKHKIKKQMSQAGDHH